MKKYGIRVEYGEKLKCVFIYVAQKAWSHCSDEDGKFGTNDLNEAYQFLSSYNDPKDTLVYEKGMYI